MGFTLPALTFALSLDRIMNGVTRPFFGWVSDQIGRETTMFLAFMLEGLGILALRYWGDNPVRFVLLSGLVFFAWGEIYSLFPALSSDIFGRRFATANYGLLYTAKGTAALVGPTGERAETIERRLERRVFMLAAASAISWRPCWRCWCCARRAARGRPPNGCRGCSPDTA